MNNRLASKPRDFSRLLLYGGITAALWFGAAFFWSDLSYIYSDTVLLRIVGVLTALMALLMLVDASALLARQTPAQKCGTLILAVLGSIVLGGWCLYGAQLSLSLPLLLVCGFGSVCALLLLLLGGRQR